MTKGFLNLIPNNKETGRYFLYLYVLKVLMTRVRMLFTYLCFRSYHKRFVLHYSKVIFILLTEVIVSHYCKALGLKIISVSSFGDHSFFKLFKQVSVVGIYLCNQLHSSHSLETRVQEMFRESLSILQEQRSSAWKTYPLQIDEGYINCRHIFIQLD